MDEKRYQVFISSTYTDLVEERTAVIQAIQRMDHIPAGMELFPAANEDQWDLIKQVIDQSDYYVVVVAGRYGSITEEGVSYTEKEYDYAVASNIPVLGFVHEDPDELPGKKIEQNTKAQELLAAFREKVKSKPVNFFSSPEGLSGKVVLSLMGEIRKNPRVGWVRGDKAMTVETEKEILDLRKELEAAQKAREEAESSLVEDTSQLAQGEDIVEIDYRITYWHEGSKYSLDTSVPVSWNELFAAIGAIMIDEATVKQAKDRCDTTIFQNVPDETLTRVPKGASNVGTVLYSEDWETVELQFRALGLIDSGVKKRGIQDTNKYLRLTDRGLRHLAFLRAIKRPTGSATE